MRRLWTGAAHLALAAVVILAAPAAARATPVLFGITFSEQLIRLDPLTGIGSPVGALDSGMSAFGLTSVGTRLYAYDQRADRLQELDPANAQTLASIDIGGVNLAGEGAVELGGDGVGWVTESRPGPGRLWQFDLGAGTATLVTNLLTPSLDGLALEPGTGTLFGISQLSFGLYTVDPSTGATTAIRTQNALVGPGRTDIAGLAFGPDDTLWLAAVGNLYSVDKIQGTVTLVGSTGYDVSGLAWIDFPEEPIPEPATVLLLGGGLLALGWRARRCSRR